MTLSKLFISYRSLDSAKVDAMMARLRSLKNEDGTLRYSVWQDKTSIPDGQDWWQSVVDAIINCDVFVFIISQVSLQSIICRAELMENGLKRQMMIVFQRSMLNTLSEGRL